jgi:arylsulfatase A-like enzyme
MPSMLKHNHTRRDFLKTVGFGMATYMVGSRCASKARDPEKKPNFLFILTDDQTFRAIGYNNPCVKTPSLDSLAARGLIFDYAYVASPICVASRASILTSLYPQQHESVALRVTGFRKGVVRKGKYKTVAQLLSAAGYRTGLWGKSHLGDPKSYGFQEGRQVNDKKAFLYAKGFLEKASEDKKPFFLCLSTHKPHIPLMPDKRWLDLYQDVHLHPDPNFREMPLNQSLFNQGLPGQMEYLDSHFRKKNYKSLPAGPPRTAEIIKEYMKAYYATISQMDYEVGELVSYLKSLDLYNNTVIFFFSDNGYFLGNHGLGNKITMHEESVRVPMFIHWDGLPKRGIRCRRLVSSLDVYPTVLELAGIATPAYVMGKSLVPLFSDPTRSFRGYVASECVGIGGKKGTGHRMVRTERWKYMLSGTNEEGLFDEQEDPYELKNLAGHDEVQEVLSQMRGYMKEWMKSVGDTHALPPETSIIP